MLEKAVILARGLGTRMRRDDDAVQLSAEQKGVSETGVKALVSVGRPFIDYVFSALAEVGIRKICLVIGPEHSAIREHCDALPLTRIKIEYAIQEKPIGTADALKSARDFTGRDQFIMLNSDNYYPIAALEQLIQWPTQGLVGFVSEGLVQGNITPERIQNFAVLQVDHNNTLERILEKPSPEELATFRDKPLVSMNCWRFGSDIYEACDNIELSPRGEWELVSAVQYGIEKMNQRWHVLPFNGPVWDLTSRQDIAKVQEGFKSIDVRF
jgi:dTDP-glucose pyrophosphorylase